MVTTSLDLTDDSAAFTEFCVYLKKVSGITLSADKAYLVTSRVRQIMAEYEFSNLRNLLKQLNAQDRVLQQKVIDAMTTNETFWFRDGHPFDFFTNTIIPELTIGKNRRSGAIKIWSAACSSGQEPYSIAMLLEEYKSNNSLSNRVEITATDLSKGILNAAEAGVYDQLSIGRGLSAERLNKFFSSRDKNSWKVKPILQNYIRFQSLNLLDSYNSLGKFDIIYCRNVLIYFARETKSDIIRRMHKALNPGGYLILGSSEGLGDASSLFNMINCKPGLIYQSKEVV